MSRLPPLRSANPIPIGAVFIALVVLLFYVSFNVNTLPFVGGGQKFSAAFSEAAGLKAGNDVRIGGVKVGEVEDVSLEGTHVRVDFTVDGARLGRDTRAGIDIATLLGSKYLSVSPQGEGKWDPDEQLPLSRTTAPFDVVPAFADVSRTVDAIDTQQLATAFTTLAETFRGAPPHIRGALDGLTRLSKTVSSRDDQLTELLGHTEQVSGVLATQRTKLTTAMGDGSLVLRELDARRAAIHQLLVGAEDLATQLSGLVDDNKAQIGPALSELKGVTQILAKNDKNLQESLKLLYPTTRNLINAVGTGAWYDAIVQNITPIPALPVDLGVVDPGGKLPTTIGELLGTPLQAPGGSGS